MIEPDKGWVLLWVDDLGDLVGTCEREHCGNKIRYEHLTYHPNWGYKIVGSTCIEHLTQEDQELSKNLLNIYKIIRDFVHKSNWEKRISEKGNKYIRAKYKNHYLSIYGEKEEYSFQIAIKDKGAPWYDYGKFIEAKGKSLDEVKELVYIVLKGTLMENEDDKKILRSLYKNIR